MSRAAAVKKLWRATPRCAACCKLPLQPPSPLRPGYVSGLVRAEKVGGSYQAKGQIVATFNTAHTGETRHVFEFDEPRGMLHIFGPAQVAIEGAAASRVQREEKP